MIDIALVEEPVDIKKYKLVHINKPTAFLGFIIRNQYDDKRLSIDKKYNPLKFSIGYRHKDDINILPLYGILVNLNKVTSNLSTVLLKQERYESTLDLNEYMNILSEYNLSCNDCYGYFYKNVYPIDNRHFDKLTNDEIGKDKKIFQHLLNVNENKFDFQKFGSLKLLLLT